MFKPMRSVVETIVKLARFCIRVHCAWFFSSYLDHYLKLFSFNRELSGNKIVDLPVGTFRGLYNLQIL